MGVMEVSTVIGKLREHGDASSEGRYREPKPLAADALARLRLPTGEPIPEDLAAWLAYDATWLGLLTDGELPGQTLRAWLTDLLPRLDTFGEDTDEELREWVGEELETEVVSDEQLLAWWIEQLPSPELADVHVVRLPSGDQDNLLMLEPGRPALRVLGFHKFIELWWKYDTFADYLAHTFGFVKR